jgi:hypothetical protein
MIKLNALSRRPGVSHILFEGQRAKNCRCMNFGEGHPLKTLHRCRFLLKNEIVQLVVLDPQTLK